MSRSRCPYEAINPKNALGQCRLQQPESGTQNIRRIGAIRILYSGKLLSPRNHWKEDAYDCRNSNEKGENMKKLLLSIALACVAPFAWAQVSQTTTTTTTTEGTGTITEYTPGSAIVLKEASGPVRYRFGKTVTYVTRSGRVLDEDTVRTRVRVGVPVRVHYVGTAPDMMVDRVIVDED
jgi:hypothetical protein